MPQAKAKIRQLSPTLIWTNGYSLRSHKGAPTGMLANSKVAFAIASSAWVFRHTFPTSHYAPTERMAYRCQIFLSPYGPKSALSSNGRWSRYRSAAAATHSAQYQRSISNISYAE